jgi:hypothetical protein
VPLSRDTQQSAATPSAQGRSRWSSLDAIAEDAGRPRRRFSSHAAVALTPAHVESRATVDLGSRYRPMMLWTANISG